MLQKPHWTDWQIDKPPCSRSRLHTTQLRRGSCLGSSSPLFGERPLLGTAGLSAAPTPVPGGTRASILCQGPPETGGQNWILKMRHTEFCRKGQLFVGERGAGVGGQEDAHRRTHPGHSAGRGLRSGGSPRQLLHPLGCRLVTHPHPGGSRYRPGAMLPPAAQSQPQPEGPVWTPHLDLARAQHLSDHPKVVLRPCVFTLPYLKAKNPSK